MDSCQEFGERVTDQNKLAELRKITYQSVLPEAHYRQLEENGQLDLTKFPGTIPVPISKRDFSFMRQQKYWVSEKSDGTRYMLLSLTEGLYLIDVNFDFILIPSSLKIPAASDLSSCQHNTVLDGEMVFNHFFERYCYMVFDVIRVDGEYVGGSNLRVRLECIRNEVITPLRQVYKEDDEKLPFLVLGKEFWPLEKMETILNHVQHYKDEEGPRYVYQNQKRYNENDGIIFTPEEQDYKIGISHFTKKWKWEPFNTIDFLVRVINDSRIKPPRKRFKLFLLGPDNRHVPYKQVFFPPNSQLRLLNDLQGGNEGVIECSYDGKVTGEWQYYRVRNDKNTACPITLALQTLECITENISPRDLTKGLLKKSSHHHHPSSGTSNNTPNSQTPVHAQTPDSCSPDVIYNTPPQNGKRTIDSVENCRNSPPKKFRL